MTSTYVEREPSTTFVVPRPTIGPLTGLVPHVALGYYPETEAFSFWDVAQWDTGAANWEGPAPLTDVTCDVLDLALNQGRDVPLERFRPAVLTVTLNDPDGIYSPWSTAPDSSAFGAIRVGIDLVYWVDVPSLSESHPRFRGIVTAIVDGFPDAGEGHTVTFHAADYLSLLAAYDGTERPPVGAGELAGARLSRIATDAGYTGATDFDPGTVALQATTLARNALDESGIVVDTETGAYWCDRDGVLTFRDKNGMIGDPAYTSVQAYFGDSDVSTVTEVCYSDISLTSDTDRVRNVVSIANAGGTAITRSDLTSVALYRARTFQRFDLIHVDPAESVTIANRYLDAYAYASNRVEALTVDLATLGDFQQAQMLALDVLHLVQVRRRAEGFQVVADLQIQGLSERVDAGEWTVTFRTFSATSLVAVGRWDVAQWETGLWGY